MAFLPTENTRLYGWVEVEAPHYADEACKYYRAPSRENARRLLEAFGLYVPYAAARGGEALADPPGDDGGADADAGAADAATVAPADAATVVLRANFLSDLYTMIGPSSVAFQRVLATIAGLPLELHQKLHACTLEEDAQEYTVKAVAALDQHAGLVGDTTIVSGLDDDDEDWGALRDPEHVRRERRLADARMRDLVAGWLAPNADGVAEIVLDGVLEEPITRRIHRCFCDLHHLRSFATLAFLQWMIGEWPGPHGGAAAAAPRELRFLIGTLRAPDIALRDAFLRRWIGYLRREATALTGVASVTFARLNAAALGDVPFGAPDATLAPDGDAALIALGHRVPFVAKGAAKRAAKRTARAAAADCNIRVANSYEERCQLWIQAFMDSLPAHQVAYDRTALIVAFQRYSSFTNTQRAESGADAVLNRAIAVHGFRDAFKADVAIARGAAYVTANPFALAYYELRRRALAAAPRGLSLTVSPSSGGAMTLKAYRPADGARRAKA